MNRIPMMLRTASAMVGALILSPLVLWGCVSQEQVVRARAASELGCPAASTNVTNIAGTTYAAECNGRKLTYTCAGGGMGDPVCIADNP
jgi:outer membrane murein-binding lipoprotein Lpp